MKKVYLIATFVAIIAGIATYFFATQIQSNTKIKDAPTTRVVVALLDIKENTKITAEMIAYKTITTVSVTPGAATDMKDVVGKLNLYPVVKGEQILSARIVALGEESDKSVLSYQLAPDEYAYAISIDSTNGVAGFIRKGDYVDLLYTTIPQGAAVPVTKILMTDVHVLKISNFAANFKSSADGSTITTYSEIVFSLKKAQIIELTNKVQEGGAITLALKSITVGEKYTTVAQTTVAPVQTTAAG